MSLTCASAACSACSSGARSPLLAWISIRASTAYVFARASTKSASAASGSAAAPAASSTAYCPRASAAGSCASSAAACIRGNTVIHNFHFFNYTDSHIYENGSG